MGASVGKTVTVGGVEATILKQVGEGGFADIFLARAAADNKKRFAVKRMLVQKDDKEKQKLAQWEFQVNQRLPKHPNLIAVEGTQLVTHPNGDQEYLILLEYCEGGTLLDWIQSPTRAQRTQSEVLAIFRQLVDGVAVLHAHVPQPLRHQDLKPENLLQTAPGTGQWKLIDFGSSTLAVYTLRSHAERTVAGRLIDKNTTPSYRAPEMIEAGWQSGDSSERNAPVTEAADVWALGVMLYAMLFGTQPFPDGALATLSGRYRVPEGHRWTAELMALLARMLTVQASARITVPQLQKALADLTHTPVNTPKPWSMLKDGAAAVAAAAAGASGATKSLAPPAGASLSVNSNSSAPRSGALSPGSVHSSGAGATPSPVASGMAPPVRPPRPVAASSAVASAAASSAASPRPVASPSSPIAPTPASYSAVADDGFGDDFNPDFPDPTAAATPSPAPALLTPQSQSAAMSAQRTISPQVDVSGPTPFIRAPTGLTSPQSAGSAASPLSSPAVHIRPVAAASTVSLPPAVPKLAGPATSLGTLKIGGAKSSSATAADAVSPRPQAATPVAASLEKRHSSSVSSKSKSAPADGGGSDDEEDGASSLLDEKAQSKLVKKLTKEDVVAAWPAKAKHLTRLLQASWTHRPEVAQVAAQQLQQHGSSMAPEELARHLLAWEGLPGLFTALARRPVLSPSQGGVAPCAFKALLLVHRVLQLGSPPVLGQVYLHRRFLEEVEAAWSGAQVRSLLHLSSANPVTGLLAPYAKHLLHRLAFHQLHPHFEGNFALGHFLWSLIARKHPAFPKDFPGLQPKMLRDDAHHLLQLMAESLRLASAVLDEPEALAQAAPAAKLADVALDFRHLLLPVLLDDLYAMWRACTYVLAQLCLVLGVRPLQAAPHGWPRGVITRQMQQQSEVAAAAAAVAAASSNGGSALTPPPPPPMLLPIQRSSPALAALEPHPLDLDVPLDTAPNDADEDQVLRSVPTLLAAHRTILERLHVLFAAASARSSVVRQAGRGYALPLSLHAFQPVPPEHFPPPSMISATGAENSALCARMQAHNLASGMATKHRSLALPQCTFAHALPPPLNNSAAASASPSAGAASSSAPVSPPVSPAVAAASEDASAAAQDAEKETPEQRAARKEAKRLKKESKKAKKEATNAAGAAAGHSEDEEAAAAQQAPMSVVLTPFQRASSATPRGAASASGASAPGMLQPPGASTGVVDPFASSPASPMFSPDAPPFAAMPNSANASASPAGSAGSAAVDDPFDPFSGTQASVDFAAGASDGSDPFASFASFPVPTPSPNPPIAATAGSAQAMSPAVQSPAGNASASPDITPFQSEDEADEEDVGMSSVLSDDEDDVGADEEGGAVLQSSGGRHVPRKVRTEADYLAAAGIVKPASSPAAAAAAAAASADVLSPFEDEDDEAPGRSDAHGEESSDEEEDDEDDVAGAAQFTAQQDELVADDDETPFNDDPFGAPAELAPVVAVTAASPRAVMQHAHVPPPAASVSATPFDDGASPPAAIEKSPFEDEAPHVAPALMQQQSQHLAPPPPAAVLAVSAAADQQISPFDEPAPNNSGNPFDEGGDGSDEEGDLSSMRVAKPGQALGRANPVAGGSSSSSASAAAAVAAPGDALLPDEIEFDELSFDERIGVGAYAEVYSGSWRGTDVAIKRLHASHFSSPDAVAEFRAEVQLLRTLRHPNCVLFMAACTRPPNLCVVTELMAASLFDLLHNSDTPLSWRATLQIACDIAKGCSYLHLNKSGAILHRDLKSPNILLDSGRRAKLCDFGLAKTKQRSSGIAGNAGTCQWTAPEVLAGGEYHEAADVYSFGIILHELVSRDVPYKGMSTAQVSVGVLTRGLRPSIPPNCPAQFQALMEACWAQEPANRPPFSFIVENLNAQIAEAKKKSHAAPAAVQ